MAASARFLPKQVPTDVWSLKEKLALGCSVKRSGDNNWVSVSRAVKPYGESNRPSDWFSQRNCALQYSDLLEKVETPNRRKRGEKETAAVEAPKDIIVRKLTIERIEELKRIVQEEEQRYNKLKEEVDEIMTGDIDDQLDTMEADIEKDKKAVIDREKKWVEDMVAREEAKRQRKVGQGIKIKVDLDESQQDSPADTISMEEDSNLSLASESTPQSAASQDIKPGVGQLEAGKLPTSIKQEHDLIAAGDIKLEPIEVDVATTDVVIKDEPSEAGDGNDLKYTSGNHGNRSDDSGKSALDTDIIIVEDVKTSKESVQICSKPSKSEGEKECKEPQVKLSEKEPEPEMKSKEAQKDKDTTKMSKEPEKSGVESKEEKEPNRRKSKEPEKESKIDSKKELEKGKKNKEPVKESKNDSKETVRSMCEDISEDNSSTIDAFPVSRDSVEKEIFVQVVDDKDEKDSEILDSASEGPGKDLYEEAPTSPASSIMSNDTDGGSIIARGKGRRSRGGKNRRGRRSLRPTRGRNIVQEDKAKESETSSKAESSDDDNADTTLPESDDTASNATGRHQMSFTESVPNSPASIAPGDTEDEKAFKVWKKSIMLVWRAAANHKYTNVFSHPVREEIAPGYHSIVYRPLDLSTIKKNIESGGIRTTAEFQRDMMQMFTNAIMYNNSDHDVFHMAMEMYDDVMRHIEQYVHTQIMVQGGDSKLLRTSRRSEVHSDKEDEPKRKRTTSDQDGGKSKKRK